MTEMSSEDMITGPASLSHDEMGFHSRRACADRAQVALRAAGMGSWVYNIGLGKVTADVAVAEMMGLQDCAQPWPKDQFLATIHPDDLRWVKARIKAALLHGDTFEVNFRDSRIEPETGEMGGKWLTTRGRVSERGADGAPLSLVGATWDVTAQKALETRLSVLADEMEHRVKNAFGIIRALVNLGETEAEDATAFAETLRGQVQAIADAHAISAQMVRAEIKTGEKASLRHVFETVLAPWVKASGTPDFKLALDIAPEIILLPREIGSLAMLIHELATNATKHGPLGERGGQLSISVTQLDEDEVQMLWTESVPSNARLTQAPSGQAEAGFGSILITHCAHALRGQMDQDLTETGLRVRFRMRLEGALASQ